MVQIGDNIYEKKYFVAMILGTISCIFFALGMCMALLPEWNAFRPGVITGCIGLVFALITIYVWRKMEQSFKLLMIKSSKY